MRKLLVLASLGVVVALATVAGAQGAIVSKITVDLTGLAISNPCNGETVNLTGTSTITMRETDAGSGRVNVGVQDNVKADGVGVTTGAAYRWNEVQNATDNNATVDDNGAVAINVAINSTIVGQGNVPNFKGHTNEHMTMTPDGTITVDRIDFTSSCQ